MVAENLEKIKSSLAPYPGTRVIGACKGQPEARIAEALAAGLTDFGENRVQEARERWEAFAEARAGVRLHFIGALQENKAREAVALFDCIHSVDRESLAETLMREIERQGRAASCLIQVNTGEEPQKSGVFPGGADALIACCRALGLPLAGLMCVPPAHAHPAPHFALLRVIAQRNGLSTLSMGMSADYLTAARLGATHVRLGTALFGARA